MPLPLQAKLLRVLEDRSFMRVGGTETITVDVRIIAATNSDLEARVAAGTFRSDLYYRLKVVTIVVPPLRERREDIPLLMHRFFEMFKAENGRPNLALAPEVVEALGQTRWEGNVRELRNLIESLVVLADAGTQVVGNEILAPLEKRGGQDPAARLDVGSAVSVAAQIIGLEILQVGDVIDLSRVGNRTRAAEILGIGLRTLQRKLREYEQAQGDPAGAEGQAVED